VGGVISPAAPAVAGNGVAAREGEGAEPPQQPGPNLIEGQRDQPGRSPLGVSTLSKRTVLCYSSIRESRHSSRPGD
jgi:hypothetical protein